LLSASEHVVLNGVDRADDNVIWSYAAERGLAIVTKDADFLQRSWLLAPPAKLIMLRVGDAGTRAVEALLRRQRNRIAKFLADPEKSLLVLAA
jgi:predicted nuclease of predicted toxin-antitoxin system